ncbi:MULTISPECIES: hypothetical protein [unclassified Streptomyces]|uniref:HNH endonuclease n=1 Tax=unclassified Streptomyces TaxID=2593676 RepID=UPI00382BCD26
MNSNEYADTRRSQPARTPGEPAWVHLMAMRRRKTLVICRRCHEDIHAGRPTAVLRK